MVLGHALEVGDLFLAAGFVAGHHILKAHLALGCLGLGLPDTGLFLALLARLGRALEAGTGFQLGELWVESFSTPHDAAGSVGYAVTGGGARMALATDLGHLTPQVWDAARGADLLVCETNHDEDWVRSGPYPYALQNRILGDRGHLSNEASAEFAVSLAAAGTHTLLLAHLSPENNTPERARTVVQGALERAHLRPEVDVLPRDECSLCYEV